MKPLTIRLDIHPGLILGLVLAALAFAPRRAAPAEPEVTPAEIHALLDARYKAAVKQYDEMWTFYKQARTDALPVYMWSHFILSTQFDMSERKPDQLAALAGHLERMRKLEALVKKVRRLGFGQSIDVGASEYYRIEAEYWLAHARFQKDEKPR